MRARIWIQTDELEARGRMVVELAARIQIQAEAEAEAETSIVLATMSSVRPTSAFPLLVLSFPSGIGRSCL
jgi:hypothetical protein